MKTYFIFSDIHSFYDEFIKALNDAGFDINNEEHVLISLGDIFDRGKKPLEIYEFLRSIPKERRILVKGNHELLLKELVKRGFYFDYDLSNGTYNTLCHIACQSEYKDYLEELLNSHTQTPDFDTPEYEEYRQRELEKIHKRNEMIFHSEKLQEILDWIDSDEWINYYETTNYIFVHSFIPIGQNFTVSKWGIPLRDGAPFYREDWRNATDYEWEDAMWNCPWQRAYAGLNKTGKTIVCGHWHTSDFFNHLTKQKKDTYDCPIFKSKKYKLIGLDACTAASERVNVLVIEEEDL